MSGAELLLDTNAVLYILSGDKTLALLVDNKAISLSIIAEMELLSYSKMSSKELKILNEFINECQVININNEIKKQAIQIRRATSLKLPDCIVAATSIVKSIPLVTSDKQFRIVDNLNLILYEK